MHANTAEDKMIIMNQLNETLMRLRVQIAAEEMQPRPDMEKLKLLRLEEQRCLKQIRS